MKVEPPQFPIAAVGASAGGVEALEGFFRGLPERPRIAVIVLTHLNPAHESVLHEIIARYTGLTVRVAEDGAPVEIDHVYVLPAGVTMGIEGGRLKIAKRAPGSREHKPIDIFFSALAKDMAEYSAGVVLSGSDGDGTLGIKAIKERGGLTIAQVAGGYGPSHPDMPANAISTGFVDFAIPVAEMGARLTEFARSLQEFDELGDLDNDEAVDGQLTAVKQEIYAILKRQVGHEFNGYKTKTFLRRVQRRMQLVQHSTLEAYVEQLRHDPKEVNALFRDLLINVTNFFRDGSAFETLGQLVIPKLFDGRGPDDTVRIWVPGCATGEEPYSIAMLLREHMDGLKRVPRVQIFATDIDEHALAVARTGRYPEALLDGVSPERRQRFFIFDSGTYVVAKEVRDMCIISPHSILRDPPFSRMDLVSCRNLLIYFDSESQKHVIPVFHYSLRPGGYLFLGKSENITRFNDIFAVFEKKSRIFQKREGVRSTRIQIPLGGIRSSSSVNELTQRRGVIGGTALRQAVETQVLERFAPAHVVVNRDGDIVYYSGRTGKYLEPAPGLPSRQLLGTARKGLRLDLRALLREAVETDRTVTREGVAIEDDDGGVRRLTLTVEPLAERNDIEPLLLVLFIDEGPKLSRDEALNDAAADTGSDDTRQHLEHELRDVRERLQSLIEEYETAVEELKSSNEELVSVNEELQSTNEELEASKEELQSLNEELHTVNAELNGKVDALDHANSDLQNLFDSTQVAAVFLDRNLVIRSFTPAVTRIFNILPSDQGRPITDLSSSLKLPNLAKDVATVLSTGQLVEHSIDQQEEGSHFLVRLAPYRRSDERIEGVVATFVDVSLLTQAEARQKVLVAELNHRVKNILTVVISVVEQTYRSASSPESFKKALVDRLYSMSRSYELLSRENWTEASIDELIRQELAPFDLKRTIISGPPISLTPKQALSVGIVLHELATNAGKYGALSVADGRVSVIWSVMTAECQEIEILWTEHDGPQVTEPKRRGFGLNLVDRETSFNLRGTATTEFLPTGVCVKMRFPMSDGGQG